MAATTEMSQRVDRLLWTVLTDLNDLPEVLEERERGELSEYERDVLSLEWDNDMHHLRVVLAPAYRAGQMTPEQAERYRALLHRLKEALPLIERLGFARPGVSLPS